jgi:transposase
MAQPILGAVAAPKRLIADKAYDAKSFRDWLADRSIKAVIPSTASRRTPYPIDHAAYRRRNVIERLFCKLKNWRRIATRYDRLARNYIAAVALAAILIAWIKWVPNLGRVLINLRPAVGRLQSKNRPGLGDISRGD